MSELARAITIAKDLHHGQVDKNGEPYIFHPLRVLETLREFDEDVVCSAVLHDVVEDGGIDVDSLSHAYCFNDEVVAAVDALTRRDGEPYMAYIDRCRSNRIAKLVKWADLQDNMRHSDDPGHEARQERYRKARERLLT